MLFAACFYHFLFWRYLNSSMTHFLSEILLLFPNLIDMNSRKAVMVARFSFVIEGIKETLEWFQ